MSDCIIGAGLFNNFRFEMFDKQGLPFDISEL